ATGGTGGATGGTGGASTLCPPAQPSGACTASGQNCVYGGNQCTCYGGSWHCNSCPGSQPSGYCSGNSGALCKYGGATCACGAVAGTPDWECITCPTNKPANYSGCGVHQMVCVYGASYCKCNWPNWNCT
ncbi:MAG: hypothetical protein DYH12_29520, partial [Sorangiineae bacterium PRO1]|nr:hypothetical protein [Sorangiineae bacterium PRO1]